MVNYFCEEDLEFRIGDLYHYGHDSSVFMYSDNPPDKGHLIEILSPAYISKPCWNEVFDAADSVETQFIDFDILDKDLNGIDEDLGEMQVYQFYFHDLHIASKMALRVSDSARDKRTRLKRAARLKDAGGHHSPKIIEQIGGE